MTQEERDMLLYKPQNAHNALSAAEEAEMNAYCEDYKRFLDASKTERECVFSAIELAEKRGFVEYKRGMAIQRQLQLVGAAEAFHLLFVLLTVYGGMAGLSFWANLLWVLLACARGWAALSLYKMQEEDA